ncbi:MULTISPECIES: ferredoxin-type protein NapF [Pasteurellaceae]|uniref:Ferredoxin-type protein NapF n=1 Tax=Rodentibacter genomosp. 1 TaxID=1908264 RepID=A0A1V3J8A8_9PAST|nr:ferredoxin-type protein NapF [Rodentibacter genomosp. 1]MBF0750884.1 ferredoxin-type protein NapF [Pasteurella sp. 19428wF3_WM03]OOF51206.1 ferredoxin-type protein NapF [Rodentibacter genomosp. 1]TFU53148.1 ferredoxin-type protein NapF [Pasteurella sp. WM03]
MVVENLPRRQFLRGRFLTQSQKNKDCSGVIRPPWSINNAEFTQQCTGCGDCFAVCETHILVKDDDGFPEVRFENGECTFCQKCVEACEQPIFRSLEDRPWGHKIMINENCLTHNRIECRSCQDNCSMNAIRFRLQIGRVAQPLFDAEICNGCGACLQSCPVRAIKIVKNE